MSINKKVVWLPYDMDTAIGINNSGLLVFGYNLEDIDLQQGGEFIFNGQDSVMWTNLRDAYGDDIRTMYQNLRSSGALSYDKIEKMFEDHQNKWSEAIFNEDAYFKYIEPLTNPEAGKQPDASYLPMAQGSKAEQRKWWLYNRFRYMDSKWNAGDALQDYIMMRAYSVAPQVLTPYADIYLTTSWDGELTQVRATRGQTYTLPCPKDTANDAVVAIYSASQLSSVGDLSGLKIKSGNFSMATRLQSLKIGDNTEGYSNTNLTDLQLGNNTLLSVLDVRNCPNLTQTVDLRGCSNIEEVYFDGTSIAAAQLPNGGILRVLHLPDTVTNLTLRNQQNIEDFTMNDYSMISTLRLENCGIVMDEAIDIINDMQTGNIRLVGIDWDFDDGEDFKTTFNKIDTCGGIDDTDIGFPTAVAQLQGAVHTSSARQSYFRTLQSRYPYVAFTADELTTLVNQFLGGVLTEYVDDEIETISQFAFYDMDSLVRVESASAEVVGEYAFQKCDLLETITFSNVKTTGQYAFAECKKLNSVSFPKLMTLGNFTFNSDIRLTSIDLPMVNNNIYACFQGCTSLTNVSIPSVTIIQQNCFNGCTSLENIYAPLVTELAGYGTIGSCTSLEKLDFPSLTKISSPSAFSGDTALIALILRKTSAICTLSNVGAFSNTKYATNGAGGAYVYVPRDLIPSYQAATNWSTLYAAHSDMFRALEDYTVDGTTTGEFDETKI